MRRKHYNLLKKDVLLEPYGKKIFKFYIKEFTLDSEFNSYEVEQKEKKWLLLHFIYFKKIRKISKKILNTLFKHYDYNLNKNRIIVEPAFLFTNQFFARRTLFYDFLKKNNLEGNLFFSNNLDKNIFENVGHNFYINNVFNVIDENIFNDETYKNVIKLKFITNYLDENSANQHLNILLNFNLNILLNLEIYKIIILLNLIKFKIN